MTVKSQERSSHKLRFEILRVRVSGSIISHVEVGCLILLNPLLFLVLKIREGTNNRDVFGSFPFCTSGGFLQELDLTSSHT